MQDNNIVEIPTFTFPEPQTVNLRTVARKPKLLNLYETAERLEVPVGWLKDMALSNQLPCLRVGKRKLRFEVNAVTAAMAKMAARSGLGTS